MDSEFKDLGILQIKIDGNIITIYGVKITKDGIEKTTK